MEIVWTDAALESLYAVVEYVQYSFNQRQADNVARNIISFVSDLGCSPKIGKRIVHLSQYGEIRCVYYKINHIYYRIFGDRIEVLLVWDGRQNPERLRAILQNCLSI